MVPVGIVVDVGMVEFGTAGAPIAVPIPEDEDCGVGLFGLLLTFAK